MPCPSLPLPLPRPALPCLARLALPYIGSAAMIPSHLTLGGILDLWGGRTSGQVGGRAVLPDRSGSVLGRRMAPSVLQPAGAGSLDGGVLDFRSAWTRWPLGSEALMYAWRRVWAGDIWDFGRNGGGRCHRCSVATNRESDACWWRILGRCVDVVFGTLELVAS